MSSTINTTTAINPKPCNYNCGTRIYWNNEQNSYYEVFSKTRHQCPNRQSGNNSKNVTQMSTKPNYYKKSYYATQKETKPKMSNSFELLTGPISEIQKKYEILSDLVTEYNGKVHGSQRDRDPKTGLIDLMVYYKFPEGKREEVKKKI